MARMKCPNCGSTNDRTGTRCLRCGSPLVEQPPALATPESNPTKQAVPEWRKEVTRKAREYGEKKRVLTTPPHPLKEQSKEPQVEALSKDYVLFHEPEPNEPVFVENEIPTSLSKEQSSAPMDLLRQHEPVIPVIQKPSTQPRLELDLQGMIEPDEEPEAPIHLGRRAASLAVDQAILGTVVYVVAFLCREVLSYDLRTVFQTNPVPLIGAVLLFHFLYYFYFLKTARQTPGQVFFSLEVRDPNSGGIGAGKIFWRWASLVFLNVLNLLPFLLGKRFFVLDRLSGTEVRSMKPKD